MVALVGVIVHFFINFENQFMFFLLSAIIIILVLIALFPILTKIYQNTLGLISFHDLENRLLSAAITTSNMNDPQEIKKIYYEISKDFGVDASKFNKKWIEDGINQSAATEKKIEDFIKTKLHSRERDNKSISEITCDGEHKTVDLSLALTWLGTMLDNALDSSDNNPIIIGVIFTSMEFVLEVSNEYVGESQNIQLIFERGYSTKESGRGIGLHNLYTKVTELGGTVTADTLYMESFDCQYLCIRILFEHNEYEELLKMQKEGKS
jgi:hypothetical protein